MVWTLKDAIVDASPVGCIVAEDSPQKLKLFAQTELNLVRFCLKNADEKNVLPIATCQTFVMSKKWGGYLHGRPLSEIPRMFRLVSYAGSSRKQI